jgi:hypothetical protein
MKTQNHHTTVLFLIVGVLFSILLSVGAGLWIDSHHRLGSQGLLAFIGAAAAIFFVVEGVAGLAGEWVESRRLHGRTPARIDRR